MVWEKSCIWMLPVVEQAGYFELNKQAIFKKSEYWAMSFPFWTSLRFLIKHNKQCINWDFIDL